MPDSTRPGRTPQRAGRHRTNEMPPGTFGMEPAAPAWHPSITYLLVLVLAEWFLLTVLLRLAWA
jgi:hypothetical protein